MIYHENFLPADNSHEISCLICYFLKSGKILNFRLLQIIGGALRVKDEMYYYFQISENGRIPTSSQILHRNGVPPFLNGPNVQQMDHMSYPQHRTHIQSHDHIWPSQTTVPTVSVTIVPGRGYKLISC